MSPIDLFKLLPQAIDLLQRIHSGEYDSELNRELIDDLLERRADADRIPSMTHEELQAYLTRPPKFPKREPWLTWCLEHKPPLLNTEDGVHWLTDFGLIALEIANTAPPAEQPKAEARLDAEARRVEPDPPQYVTLDRMAAHVNRSKRTLERLKSRKNNPLPSPDIEGGGGKPDEWEWLKIKPWLEEEYGRKLPSQFPPRL